MAPLPKWPSFSWRSSNPVGCSHWRVTCWTSRRCIVRATHSRHSPATWRLDTANTDRFCSEQSRWAWLLHWSRYFIRRHSALTWCQLSLCRSHIRNPQFTRVYVTKVTPFGALYYVVFWLSLLVAVCNRLTTFKHFSHSTDRPTEKVPHMKVGYPSQAVLLGLLA